MQDQWLWVAVSVAEVLFVLVLILFVAWIRSRAARRRDRLAIRSLVAATRKGKDERMAEISTFLERQFELEDDALKRATRALYRAEVGLIQLFAQTYLERDTASASGFGKSVYASTAPYWELTPATAAVDEAEALSQAAEEATVAPSEDDVDGENDEEVARLRGENTRLSEELKVTMDTMSRMLNEYSTVFAKDSEPGNISVQDAFVHEAGDTSLTTGVQPHEDVSAAGVEAAQGSAESVPVATEDPLNTGDVASEQVDPEDILAAAQSTPDEQPALAESGAGASDEDRDELDPDALLAEVAAAADATPRKDAGSDSGSQAGTEDDAERFNAELDAAMKDLSADDEDTDIAGSESADEAAVQAAKRQRVIDAES